MAQNHVWRYTLRLFHTFAIFEKYQKIDAKRDAKSCHFWSKNRPWARKGRLILHFSTIWENLKNRSFLETVLGAKKSQKIGPRVARRRQTRPRVFTSRGGSCRPGPHGDHARDQKVEKGQLARGKKDQRERRQVEKWKKGKVEKGRQERRKGRGI